MKNERIQGHKNNKPKQITDNDFNLKEENQDHDHKNLVTDAQRELLNLATSQTS